MMKRYFIFFALFFLVKSTSAADDQYSIAKIPLQLLKGANAVVRLDEQTVVLKSLEKMVIRNHYVITILNEKGDRFADLTEQYDKFNSIESIDGNLYNAEGKKIKSLKKNEIKDVS